MRLFKEEGKVSKGEILPQNNSVNKFPYKCFFDNLFREQIFPNYCMFQRTFHSPSVNAAAAMRPLQMGIATENA